MRQKSGPEKQPAEEAIKDIRRATRRHFSAEDKIRIVLEGLRGEDSIAELCRKEGINQNLYYRWSKEFLEAGKKRLAGDTAREATSDEVKDLRAEARQLKETLAEVLTVRPPAAKTTLKKPGKPAGPGDVYVLAAAGVAPTTQYLDAGHRSSPRRASRELLSRLQNPSRRMPPLSHSQHSDCARFAPLNRRSRAVKHSRHYPELGSKMRTGERVPPGKALPHDPDFIGLAGANGRQFCYCWPSRRSMRCVRDKLRTWRETRVSLGEKIVRLNRSCVAIPRMSGTLNHRSASLLAARPHPRKEPSARRLRHSPMRSCARA